MKVNPSIIVISSFAEDVVTDLQDAVQTLSGGPAYWIQNTFGKVSQPFRIITGKETSRVHIQLLPDGETGSSVVTSPIELPDAVSADLFLISTIFDEFSLDQLTHLSGKIVLDVQGYVRVAKKNNRLFSIPTHLADKISVLKATKDELKFVDPEMVERQKKKILIVTRGSAGFEVFSNSICTLFNSTNVVAAQNTIGAGDVFLSSFCSFFLKSESVLDAASRAREMVEKFLQDKAMS